MSSAFRKQFKGRPSRFGRAGRGMALKKTASRARTASFARARILEDRDDPNEHKFVDLAAAAYAVNTTGSITHVSIIPQGAGASARIGRKCTMTSIQIRGVVSADNTTTTARGRLIVVYDNQPNGALPAITAVVDTANPSSFTNDANRERFRVLVNECWSVVGNNLAPTTDSAYQSVDIFRRFKLPVKFLAAGTGAIADVQQGALYAILLGDVAAGTADVTAVLGYRVRFQE